MRKLIRVASVAFLVWAVTTFAWAALSHVTGVTGPAEASGNSLELVASAVTFMDPPGMLGAPQRFAAGQIRQAADAVERLHRGPERFAARVVDELGHRHRHGRKHRHVHRIRIDRDFGQNTAEAVQEALRDASIAIRIDEFDQARAHAQARARIELERHRGRLDRSRERIEYRRELNDRERERIQRSIERISERLDRLRAEKDGEWKRNAERALREILRRLQKELEESTVIEIDDSRRGQELELFLNGSSRMEFRGDVSVDGDNIFFDADDVEVLEETEDGKQVVKVRIRNR